MSDRGRDHLRFYRIDPKAGPNQPPLVDVTADDVPFAFSADQDEVNEQTTAYGLATYRSPFGDFAVVTRRHTTTIGLFRIVADGDRVSYRRVDTLDFPATFTLPNGTSWAPCEDPGDEPQLEGLTVDPVTGTLYAAQEDIALWRLSVIGGRFLGKPRVVEYTREFGVPATFDPVEEECVVDFDHDPGFGGRIVSDVEGLTIFQTGLLRGTLVVSSQGDNTFFTYDRLTNRPLDHFEITDGPATDGVQDCDGAAVVNVPLPGFPHGLLVVHDGENTPQVLDSEGEVRDNTDFKYLDAGFLRR